MLVGGIDFELGLEAGTVGEAVGGGFLLDVDLEASVELAVGGGVGVGVGLAHLE